MPKPTPMTPFAKATEIKRMNPHLRIAYNPKGEVGLWCESLQRFYALACLAITGEWVRMPYEILVDGKPLPRQWIEVFLPTTHDERTAAPCL